MPTEAARLSGPVGRIDYNPETGEYRMHFAAEAEVRVGARDLAAVRDPSMATPAAVRARLIRKLRRAFFVAMRDWTGW